MVKKKTKSKRQKLKTKYLVQKLSRDHKKKLRRKIKQMGIHPRKLQKDPGVPNLCPFKEHFLKEAEKKWNNTKTKITKLPTNSNSNKNNNTNTGKVVSSHLKELRHVIELSDVIVFVLDSRDPEGCRNLNLEREIRSQTAPSTGKDKKLILLLNKVDLIPSSISQQWITILSKEHPTLAFTNKHKKSSKTCYPNVGKSSVINSLKRENVTGTSSKPGFTKQLQEFKLDSKITLIDSPGIIFPVTGEEDTISLVLRSSININNTDIDSSYITEKIIERVGIDKLNKLYGIETSDNMMSDNDDLSQFFLANLAKKRGKIKKGAIPDIQATASLLLSDWTLGKIPYYTTP